MLRSLILLCLVFFTTPLLAQTTIKEPHAPAATAEVQRLLNAAAAEGEANHFPALLDASEKALTVARTNKDTIGEAYALELKAEALSLTDKTDDAVLIWQEAATLWKRLEDGPEAVRSLARIAMWFCDKKNSSLDNVVADILLVARAERLRPVHAALNLYKLGLLLNSKKQLGLADTCLMEVLSVFQKKVPEAPIMDDILTTLGSISMEQERLQEARTFFLQALKIRQVKLPESPRLAFILDRLGGVESELGYLQDATSHFKAALNIYTPDSLEQADPLAHLGVISLREGDLNRAEDYLLRALAIYKKQKKDDNFDWLAIAGLLLDLGNIDFMRNDLPHAEEKFNEALDIYLLKNEVSIDAANCLSNLGTISIRQKDWAKADNRLKRALTILQALSSNSLSLARAFSNLGVLSYERNKPNKTDEAEKYLLSAIAINDSIAPYSLDLASQLYDLGGILLRKKAYKAALPQAERAWHIVLQQASILPDDEAHMAFNHSNANYADLLLQCQVMTHQSEAAFRTLQESHSRALLQLLVQRQLLGDKTSDLLQAANLASDRAQQAVSADALSEENAKKALSAAKSRNANNAEIASLNTELNKASTALTASRFRYTQARDAISAALEQIKLQVKLPEPLTPVQAQSVIPADTLYLAYSIGIDQTSLFVMAHNLPLSIISIGITEDELRKRVEALSDALGKAFGSPGQSGYLLFTTLFPNSVKALLPKYKRLLISPDGPLWEIPFGALNMSSQDVQCLGLQMPMAYTPSINIFDRLLKEPSRIAPGSHPRALVAGGMIYSRKRPAGEKGKSQNPKLLSNKEQIALSRNNGAPIELPNSATEATEIAKIYNTGPILDKHATEDEIRKVIEKADIVHFSTHGRLIPDYPLSSAILLTIPEGDPETFVSTDDGILHAWEFGRMKLRAELVVFSACETARGQLVKSEGIEGLTRVLEYAGARSTLTSLWKVNDKSTTVLMTSFHRHLRAGERKDDALLAAMREVSKKNGFFNPHQWAAFVLIGDPRNNGLGESPVKKAKPRKTGK